MSNRAFDNSAPGCLAASLLLLAGLVCATPALAAGTPHPKPFYLARVMQVEPGPCTPSATQVTCKFTIVTGNNGDIPLAGMTVTDTSPNGGAVRLTGAGCAAGASATCSRPSLTSGQSWLVKVTVSLSRAQATLAHCQVANSAALAMQGSTTLTSTATDSVQGVCQ